MPHKVLFVDDEPQLTEGLKRELRKEPYEVLTAASAREALDLLNHQSVDVIVSDEKMPGMSGSEFLALARSKYPDTVRIMLTGHATLDAAIHAINQGEIFRLLTKPCDGVDLATTIRQALQQKELAAQSWELLKKVKTQSTVLEQLEKDHPGITRVKRNMQGAVIVDDADCDLDTLIRKINEEVNKVNAGN